MRGQTLEALIEATGRVVREHQAALDELDAVLGDGDHGSNLARGLELLLERKEALGRLPLGDALMRAGLTLQETVGGASGPLWGALLVEMGRATPEGPVRPADLAAMLEAGVTAVRRVGRVAPGQKTLMDVLAPVADAARVAADGGSSEELGTRLVAAAADGLHRTSRLVAVKGRASAHAGRSLGHLDPGACAMALLIGAVVGVLDPQPGAEG